MDDVFVLVAGPGDVGLAGFQRGAHRVEAGNEIAEAIALVRRGAGGLVFEALEDMRAHVGHDAHVDHHVGAVGDLDADLGERRIQRAHAERDDIHRAALHAALEFFVQLDAHFGGIRPVVGGAGLVGALGTDERAVFHAGDVRWRRTGEERVRAFLRVEAGEGAFFNHQRSEAVPFGLRAIAPLDGVGRAKGGHFCHPFLEGGVGCLWIAHSVTHLSGAPATWQ